MNDKPDAANKEPTLNECLKAVLEAIESSTRRVDRLDEILKSHQDRLGSQCKPS